MIPQNYNFKVFKQLKMQWSKRINTCMEAINLCNVECDRLNQATEEILIKKNRQENEKEEADAHFPR